ncbi:YqcC family protein [Mangrovibacter phragmitis]|uniref:YqcC family protein n=1 Tax=Mangrovibacter phragmitis TaxID=1691903 RepID=UPI00336ADD7E
MNHHQAVRRHLHMLEQQLRDCGQWQAEPPHASAFESSQPFFLDTLQPYEWLQWVLIPRMHALLDGSHALPENFAVAPYYEQALAPDHTGRESVLAVLVELDALFSGDKS